MLKDLTPTQRAFLKLIEALAWTAVVNIVFAIAAYLANNQTVDWKALSLFASAQALLAVLLAISKYFKANGQPLLSTAIDLAAQELIRRSGTSPVVEEEKERGLTVKPLVQNWNTYPERK